MPASRHEVPDLPPVPDARLRVGSSPREIRQSGGSGGILHLCTARGRSRS
ncbi:hypothetical protein FHX80_111482 [Streptomyces brevispora]|uniref:Uncharacterized protein n=1 Tax=Streptomyces brevispora TaxID=887462 RepID=A0A561UUQ1_9ACTN|nr:hypothetical protein FHX80_111482 [Streptomyces brevispora]